jgi:hypothetical protein
VAVASAIVAGTPFAAADGFMCSLSFGRSSVLSLRQHRQQRCRHFIIKKFNHFSVS